MRYVLLVIIVINLSFKSKAQKNIQFEVNKIDFKGSGVVEGLCSPFNVIITDKAIDIGDLHKLVINDYSYESEMNSHIYNVTDKVIGQYSICLVAHSIDADGNDFISVVSCDSNGELISGSQIYFRKSQGYVSNYDMWRYVRNKAIE